MKANAPEPYDTGQPFDADKLMDGYTEKERRVPVDPDKVLGRAMAEYRERLAGDEVEPIPVESDDEQPSPPAVAVTSQPAPGTVSGTLRPVGWTLHDSRLH